MDPTAETDPPSHPAKDRPTGDSGSDDFGDLRQRLDALRARLRAEGATTAGAVPRDESPTEPTSENHQAVPRVIPPPPIVVEEAVERPVASREAMSVSPAPTSFTPDPDPTPQPTPAMSSTPAQNPAIEPDDPVETEERHEAWPTPRNGRTSRQTSTMLLGTAFLVALLTAAGIFGIQRIMGDGGSDTADGTAARAEAAEAATVVSAAPATTAPPTTATPTTAAPTTGAPSTAAPAPAAPGATGEGEAPPEPAEVRQAVRAALNDGGFSDVSIRFTDGVLTLDGVVRAEDVADGYFAHVAAVTGAVAAVDGVDEVVSRLSLRGDETRLRTQLAEIGASGALDFETASAVLSERALAALVDAADVIQANPGLRVLVAGHTDAVGSADVNAELATARAGAVVAELIRLGVPVTRLQVVSYGELFPDADATDAENRRVEFEVAP